MRSPCATSGRAVFCARPAGPPSTDLEALDDMDAFDLTSTFVHLGLGSRATALPGFTFSSEYLSGYEARFEADGAEGRLVLITEQTASWDSWERHPAGEEVVILLEGR